MAEEEGANDPQLYGLLQLGWDAFVFVVKPIGLAISTTVYYLAFAIFFVLRLIWRPLEFLLLPVLYLGDFMLQCILAPFRFLAKFETLYIYLGIAALVGIAGGILISLISGGLQKVFGLDGKSAPPPSRSVRDWRKGKWKPTVTSDTASPQTSLETPTRRRSGKRKAKPSKPPTILEELDSDY